MNAGIATVELTYKFTVAFGIIFECLIYIVAIGEITIDSEFGINVFNPPNASTKRFMLPIVPSAISEPSGSVTSTVRSMSQLFSGIFIMQHSWVGS